jgi:hypothetical protein
LQCFSKRCKDFQGGMVQEQQAPLLAVRRKLSMLSLVGGAYVRNKSFGEAMHRQHLEKLLREGDGVLRRVGSDKAGGW